MTPQLLLPLVLASASPRRLGLLATVGVPVEADPSEAGEEVAPGTPADRAVLEVARRKAADVASRRPGRPVLAADTLVEIDGVLLGKPDGPGEARRMLLLLSGRTHRVLTGVVLLVPGDPPRHRLSVTEVDFAPLSGEEIDRYVAGTEPYDKAGAYGIQGAAGWFVTAVRGSFSNVMGLPLEQVRLLLAEAGFPVPSLGS